MDAGSLIGLASPILTEIIKEWINTKIVQKRAQNKISEKEAEILEDALKKYLERSFKKNLLMNTIVFRNQPKEIFDLYVPLTITDGKEEITVDNYPEDLLEETKKIVIVDSAGMGKSTLLKWMFINCVIAKKRIPIFIELRRLNRENSLIDELIKELNTFNSSVPRSLLLEFISQGDFTFFLDGYDEIPMESKEEVTSDLQDFISKDHNNIFILSSRHEASIASFVDFFEFHINPLSEEEAFELIKKYDKKSVNEKKTEVSISNNLINMIRTEEHLTDLNEFLTNPLMISLLFKGFVHKQVIPIKKNLFYRQVYDALFEDHDLTKGGAYTHQKQSKLDSDDFHSVLRSLGFQTLRIGVEYTKDELLHNLSKSKRQTKIDFSENLFLQDLISSVPLFYKDGIYYRWKHKSLQDYFAAQFICVDSKEHQSKILRSIYNNRDFSSFINVLDLSFDADFKTFRNTILLDFLIEADEFNDYIEHKLSLSELNLNSEEKGLIKNILFWKKIFFITVDGMIEIWTQKSPGAVQTLFRNVDKCIEEEHTSKINNYVHKTTSFKHSRTFSVRYYAKWNYDFLSFIKRKNIRVFSNLNNQIYVATETDSLNISFPVLNEVNLYFLDVDYILKIIKESESNLLTELFYDLNHEWVLYLDFEEVKKNRKNYELDIENDLKLDDFYNF